MTIYDLMPIPQLLDAKRVLCVQPHPDDMDISCGGTLARLADQGAEITYLTVTDGGAGSPVRTSETELAALRRKEQAAAGALIGVQNYEWLAFPDRALLDPAQVQDAVIRAIRVHRPDTLVTVDPWLLYESHPAHRTVGQSVAAAALFSGMPNISPEQTDAGLLAHTVERVVFTFTAKPNTQVDVTTTWERKMQAIAAHKSQFPDSTWSMYQYYFQTQAEAAGTTAGYALAENLRVLSPLHLHCNTDV
ncbi:PIG-L deacetylase family protein [Alicyclobacillus sp. ALC3]|uniref:PIG-L deacetylase family protein n=1 Tax=Alicyclobacillus sp. ALC3 TaxID=2796143 RepID=UPI002377FE0F|nr:PIG-L deacetylase family protein [Alicyclobacillus sp. ALC3]WDL98226.1 PIG-L family deacetylase [Alicyclobacillus sp. ALC3]